MIKARLGIGAGSIELALDPLLFLLVLVLYFAGYLDKYAIILASAAVHELAHVLAAALFGGRLYALRILPVGLNAQLGGLVASHGGRAFIYLCGPLANLLLYFAGILIKPYYLHDSGNMNFFILANISLAVFNMLPLLPLDGGRFLRQLLAGRIGFTLARWYIRKLSFLLAVLLTACGLFVIYRTSYNISFVVIGIYALFSLKYEDMEAALMNVRDVVYRRTRLKKKGIYTARDLVVMNSMLLGEVIKSLDYDCFHIIHVLSEDFRLMGTFTEQEIMDAMQKYNANITFGTYVALIEENRQGDGSSV